MEFIAMDVETANADLASICQIGLVAFACGAVRTRWSTLVDPEDFFDPINVSVHGIDEHAVRGAPTFPEVFDAMADLAAGAIVASHTSFDRVALRRAGQNYGLGELECTWLDTARVVRRAWPQFSRSGYGLRNVADTLGIMYKPHDAEEDARAAGEVLVRAVQETGISVTGWLDRARRPIGSAGSSTITRDGDPEGPLYGEVVVFTGALSIPRGDAAFLAAAVGCQVVSAVTGATTLLVVGDQDVRRLAGHKKSSKHRKAEELIAQGQQIRILAEGDFRELLEVAR